ncbi:MAG: hypothetical protein AAFO76_08620 [Cyanobacteria bacterium J06607_15]
MMNLKNLAVPAFVAMSLVFTACAGNQTIETPDAVDGGSQDGIEGIEQNVNDAGDAVKDGFDGLKNSAEDAAGAVEDGAKGLGKGVEDAAGNAKDGIEQGIDDAGNAVEDWGDSLPSGDGQ